MTRSDGFHVGDLVEHIYSIAHNMKDYGEITELRKRHARVGYPDGSGYHLLSELRKVPPLKQLAISITSTEE